MILVEFFVSRITPARISNRFASMSTLLLFDKEGVLLAREGGISDEIERRVRDQVRKLTGTK